LVDGCSLRRLHAFQQGDLISGFGQLAAHSGDFGPCFVLGLMGFVLRFTQG
jgi:hypothetical protein